ncbi:hypothetical protein AB3Y40_06980 [Yoonia sp. R2331]|uniref:hypothetical protein n=1 Tax=Yoonia sp. R2331 TaxID=3237238 RepID=UPI0034E545A0
MKTLTRRALGRAGATWPRNDLPWTATHRHKKGGLYRRVADAVLESDRSAVVIYDDKDGTIWVRSKGEFEDGRFTRLP